jgi:hypothetical protein
MLRSLPAGQAFMHFVDAEGMKSARVQVPLVRQVTVTNERFAQLRADILEHSVFAKNTESATHAISEREWILFKDAQQLKDKASEPTEPRNFRVPAPKPATTVLSHAQPRKDGAQAVKGGRSAVAKGERDP